MNKLLVNYLAFLIINLTCYLIKGQFVIGNINFEAFDPNGLRISYPDRDGIKLVGYHVNINKEMNGLEVGEIEADLKEPKNGIWTYFDTNQRLKKGDILYYWVFIQHQNLGYRKEGQWEVEELIKSEQNCNNSTVTKVLNRQVNCSEQLILNENFNNLNRNLWIIENYIPFFDPDYEFVTYQDNKNVIFTKNNRLIIKPKAAEYLDQIKGKINFAEKCTRKNKEECEAEAQSSFYLPPITSGKIASKLYFKYGKIEIKAKLPAGDWVYPKIYLEKRTNPNQTLWIAYSRGNRNLIGNANDDIGGTLLFSGPVLNITEPMRSSYLHNKRFEEPLSSKVHTYSVIWTLNKIEFYCDNILYGSIIEQSDIENIDFTDYMRLIIGVSVGGINDFPDGYKSGNKDKPWTNSERLQVKKFFVGKNQWIPTWSNGEPLLEIYHVKIWTI